MTKESRKTILCRKMKLPLPLEPLSIDKPPPALGTLHLVDSDEDHIYVCLKNHEGECEFPEENEL